jgi:hypothetical protein
MPEEGLKHYIKEIGYLSLGMPAEEMAKTVEPLRKKLFELRHITKEEKEKVDLIHKHLIDLNTELFYYPFIDSKRVAPNIDRIIDELQEDFARWKIIRARTKLSEVTV